MLATCYICKRFITVTVKMGFQTQNKTSSRTAICVDCKSGKKK